MSFEVIVTSYFSKQAKPIAKKQKSLKKDLQLLIKSLQNNPKQGVLIKENCYKIRMAITSKNKGKSSGARIVTYVLSEEKTIYLLDIYVKSQKSNISDHELDVLINLVLR